MRVKICGKPCHKADSANVIVLEGVVSKLFPITNSFPALCYSPVVIVCVHLTCILMVKIKFNRKIELRIVDG